VEFACRRHGFTVIERSGKGGIVMQWRSAMAAMIGMAVLLFLFTAGGVRPKPSLAAGAPSWMHTDAAHKRVSFVVTAAQGGANGTLNFNGYANGQMTVTVPAGWNVHIDFDNSGAGALPHSLEVIKNVRPIPSQGITPAIPQAETNDLVDGVPPQQRSSLDFTAAPAGTYLWFCGVPAHGLEGMWDVFVVSTTAKAPTVTVK
jgi:sulfocyanin